MTDRELLELAAFAAGIKTSLHKETDSLWIDGPRVWNPLTDDGDALRLAVKLRLDVWHSKWPSGNSYAAAQKLWHSNDSLYYDDGVAHGTDPYAAARRAIVQAAAEIGKGMK
jgi:hypothetical protein